MIFEYLRSGEKIEDELFDSIYSEDIQKLAATHFTPIKVIQTAIQFLVQQSGTRVLDIGSGAGKFCLVGAVVTDGHFTGVELREKLHLIAKQVAQSQQLANVEFIHANITQIDFRKYEAFYFYNPFFEYLVSNDSIDTSIELDRSLYKTYSAEVKEKLDRLAVGTRLVTYYSAYDEVPDGYEVIERWRTEKITMWEKVK